ncbi:GNAT family N-acetyltransferase [Planococcus plakortidis]|uniref:GNAT family N-acetyltransferase n=1 Tax=Planococcus plakortidis TaxID=1038856 RepID=A0A1C7EAF4_9BACL|nr:GNAT family protein [Planococcus plakortidis]ANU20719.1 GNAT family N-acetyltransferase [Planococcus plakortidis]
MQFPILETERLLLTEITEQDTDRYFALLQREDVTYYYGMDRLLKKEEALEMIRAFRVVFEFMRGMRWGIRLRGEEALIGTIGLNQLQLRSKKTEVGYELHPDYWRQGLMEEALTAVLAYCFDELGLYRVGATTYPANTGSNRLLKKLGFTEEGRLRGYLYQRGESYDALIFSLLAPEWQMQQRDN